MNGRQIIERLREGEPGRARLLDDAAAELAKRMPLRLRRAAIVNAAIRATQPQVVGRRGYAGPDGLEFAALMDHAATPLADELSPEELRASQREADRFELERRLEDGGADEWAREWLRMVSTGEILTIDFALMVGWFANAMEHGRKRGHAEAVFPRVHFDHLHFGMPTPSGLYGSGAFAADVGANDVPDTAAGRFLAAIRASADRLGADQ